jgi:putative ABC transport system permease protein
MRRVVFFLRLFVWFNLRNMRKNPGRALTVLCGIALGAAVFTSVRLSINASLDSFSRSMDLFAGRADRVVICPGGYVPEEIIAAILRHPAIRAASPVMSTYVRPVGQTVSPFLLIGFDPILDHEFRSWQIAGSGRTESGSWLDLMAKPYTLMLGQRLATELHVAADSALTLEHARQQRAFQVAGILASEGLALVEGGRIALTDIATFQEFVGLFGAVDRIDIAFESRATPEQREDFRRMLPADLVLTSPSAAKESGQGMIRAYQLNLSILSFTSLFVGMFLVYSLVALNAASRRHELAVLRSVGASARLIFALFVAEGALFGVAGWLSAIPISSVLVRYLLQGVSQTISTLFVRLQVEHLVLSGWEIMLSFGVTVAISVLAAFQPAREAMTVAPKEAMEISQHGRPMGKMPQYLALAGLIAIVLVLPLSGLPAVFDVPLPGYVAILLLFVGFCLLTPWLLEQFGQFVSPALRRLAGVPAYLASRYVRESGNRTAVSVGALITAVALFASLVIMIHSFRRTVELWVHQTVSGDLFVTTKMGELNRFRYPIPEQIVAQLKQLKTPVDLVPNRRFFLTYDHFPYEFEALDMTVFLRHGGFVWLQGDGKTLRLPLGRGDGVVVSEVFSNRTGLKKGDTFRARIETSVVQLPILGIVRDYRTQGGVVFYSMAAFKARYYDCGWGGVRMFLREPTPDVDAAVVRLRREIIEHCGENLDMIAGKELRQSVLRVFDETFAVTTVLLLIALVVAALGITTTLTVLVLERSWQLNTLFAVGASFGQIRAMIFWEAAFMVVVGELAGLICGFILSYLLVYVINRQSFGWTFLYVVNWRALGMSLPLIIATALAAALPAIRLVFRQPPATVLRER